MLPPKFYSQANGKARPFCLHERVKNDEADDNGLNEKEDGVELMRKNVRGCWLRQR